MPIKILGIVFLIVGGAIALTTLLPLITFTFQLLGLLIKLAVAVVFLYVGRRLVTQD